MATTFNYYGDAGLVTPANPALAQASDGSSDPVDVQIWIGSADATRKIQDAVDPGVSHLAVSVTDSAPGSGQAVSTIKLAATQSALTSAVAGASLDLGVTEILGGVSEAVDIWMRFDASSLTAGQYTDIGLTLGSVLDTAI